MFYLQLRRAIKMPFSGSDRWKRLAIGGLLWLSPILATGAILDSFGLKLTEQLFWAVTLPLMLPAIVLTAGYCARVMREEASATPDQLPTEPPALDNWIELASSGIRVVAPVLIYIGGLVAIVLLTKFLTGLPLFEHEKMKDAGLVADVIEILFKAVGLLLFYFLPNMAVHVAMEGSFKSGFQTGTILDRMCPLESTEAMMDTSCLFLLTLPFACTGLLFPPALFAALVASANVWAQAYRLSATCGKPAKEKDLGAGDSSDRKQV